VWHTSILCPPHSAHKSAHKSAHGHAKWEQIAWRNVSIRGEWSGSDNNLFYSGEMRSVSRCDEHDGRAVNLPEMQGELRAFLAKQRARVMDVQRITPCRTATNPMLEWTGGKSTNRERRHDQGLQPEASLRRSQQPVTSDGPYQCLPRCGCTTSRVSHPTCSKCDSVSSSRLMVD